MGKKRFVAHWLVALLAAPMVHADTFTFTYDSEPGDFIGQGGMATWTDAEGTWSASRNSGAGVRFGFAESGGPSFWALDFAAPGDIELTAGTYTNAERFPFNAADRPGLSVTGEGRGCNTLTGEFTVTDVRFDWYGVPVLFSGAFEQHCEGADPALFGTMDYDLEFGGQPLSEGNFILSVDNRIFEYNLAGQRIQVIPILESPGSPPALTEFSRDLTTGPDGRIHLFNGTFSPVLSSGNIETTDWEHNTFDGWSTINNVTYGGIAAQGRYVYVTDMIGSDSGLVRFDTSDNFSAQRFEAGTDYIDLTIGLDGLLYALQSDGDTVDVFALGTLAFVRTLTLDSQVRGLAVTADGEIFAVEFGPTIFHFDANGMEVNSQVTVVNFGDIALAPDGTIVAGAANSSILTTDTDLGPFTVFSVGSSSARPFVSFVGDTSRIFQDGFESGDTSQWSEVSP